MYLIAGLGNPGIQYRNNRHNVGFQCMDALADKHGLKLDKKNMNAVWGKGTIASQEVILSKPQTFMNLSGKSVAEMVRFYKIPLTQVLIVADEMDLPFGRLRFRSNGSSAGQNGLKNIIEMLGTNEVPRLRVGVGRPSVGQPRDYLLNDFNRDQTPYLPEIYERVAAAIETWLQDGIVKAMNLFN